MPGFKTHYFFGKRVLAETAEGPVRDSLQKYIHSFGLGLQGPDVFFYYVPAYVWYKRNIGTRMHSEATAAFFEALIGARCRLRHSSDRRIADAYICGFMSHYCLDCIVHPYVYDRTKSLSHPDKKLYDFGIHVFLETDIDNAVTLHDVGKNPSEFDPWNTIALSPRERIIISFLLHEAIKTVFPDQKMCFKHIFCATKAMYIEQRLMHDPTGIKKKLVRLLEKYVFHTAVVSPMIPNDHFEKYKDPCNLRHLTWKNPWNPDKTSSADVYRMMHQGSKIMRDWISLYETAMGAKPVGKSEGYFHTMNRLLTELGDCSYLSGLPL